MVLIGDIVRSISLKRQLLDPFRQQLLKHQRQRRLSLPNQKKL